MPRARFLHIRRDPVQTGLSLLRLRETFHTDPRVWLSVRPRAADPSRDAVEQVAQQLLEVERAHRAAREVLGDRWMTVDHAAFCAAPAAVLEEVIETPAEPPPIRGRAFTMKPKFLSPLVCVVNPSPSKTT